MPTIFRFFWFICAVVMAVNLVIWRSRFAAIVDRGVVTKTEADRFLGWAAIWLVGGSIAFGVIGLMAGWSSPFCAGMFEFDTWPRTAVSLLMAASQAALLLWVWRSGAAFLGRVLPALGQRPSYDKPYSPTLIRGAVTVLTLVSGVGASIAWRQMPVPSNIACPPIVAAPAATTG